MPHSLQSDPVLLYRRLNPYTINTITVRYSNTHLENPQLSYIRYYTRCIAINAHSSHCSIMYVLRPVLVIKNSVSYYLLLYYVRIR